jgi:hypothetical protein
MIYTNDIRQEGEEYANGEDILERAIASGATAEGLSFRRG